MSTPSEPAALEDARYVALTTFRRTGAHVTTPFGALHRQGKVYCFTDARSGKVKRIRRNARVEIAPCTRGGAPTGPVVSGRARILEGTAAKEMAVAFNELWTRQFGVMWRIGSVVERLRHIERVVIEIELDADDASHS